MSDLNEQLLNVWLQLSTVVNNERVVSDVPYNESLICNLLYQAEQQNSETRLTATDLCNATKMLKSQMNRTLNSMEAKGFITRDRSATDKRQVYVSLNPEHTALYKDQHDRILKSIDIIIQKMGREKTVQTINLLSQITNIAKEVF